MRHIKPKHPPCRIEVIACHSPHSTATTMISQNFHIADLIKSIVQEFFRKERDLIVPLHQQVSTRHSHPNHPTVPDKHSSSSYKSELWGPSAFDDSKASYAEEKSAIKEKQQKAHK